MVAINYKDSGVDWQVGDKFVSRIRSMVESTHGPKVKTGIGGFASLFELEDGRLLAASTDGVGTKLKVAQQLGQHETVGIDLVAMCVNDVICVGAKPLFFLDYLATGKLDLETSTAVVKGIVNGCKQGNLALVGGETAEMPGMYSDGEYDLAGFCVGEVTPEALIDGTKITSGDSIIALPSTGVHSNGFSLVRKVINDEARLAESLTPTAIYVNAVQTAMETKSVKGIAHITGSGFHNIPRMNKNFGYQFNQLPQEPQIFAELRKATNLSDEELFSTFNMGVGLVMVTNEPDAVLAKLTAANVAALVAGVVTNEPGVRVDTENIQFQLK